MSRLIDLTGRRFGMLTVLCRSDKHASHVYWTCQCDCGNRIEVLASNLRRGHTTSCGCRRTQPYIGRRFGSLTVLEKTDQKVRHGSTLSPLWKCRCDCGNFTLVRLDSLTSGNIKSCGCMEKEGKIQKMRQAAGFVSGTQISKILRILEHNAVADADEMIGVIYDRKSRKWRVSLQFQGVTHRLGSYNTPAQAAQARRKAEKEWFIPFLEQTIRETSPAAAKKNVPSTST